MSPLIAILLIAPLLAFQRAPKNVASRDLTGHWNLTIGDDASLSADLQLASDEAKKFGENRTAYCGPARRVDQNGKEVSLGEVCASADNSDGKLYMRFGGGARVCEAPFTYRETMNGSCVSAGQSNESFSASQEFKQ